MQIAYKITIPFRIMERKQSSGFRRIFTVALIGYFRLSEVNVNDCQTGLEPQAGDRNRTKPATLFSFHDPLFKITFFNL